MTKISCHRKTSKLVLCAAIAFACVSLLHGQTVSPAPAVEPIVDPLTEMGPQGSGEEKDSILEMDIEQLGSVNVEVPAFDIEVSSVSKQESTIGKSPAAVFVITSEMIRRSGATCIPQALRLAPGVEVARINSHDWAISIRGFNDLYTNKLLVLIDGRSVYSPIISGVFWDMVDMPLENIERIEVIRGPGGTLWGANAVNGIINIISKEAKDVQGVLVNSGGGSQDYNISTVRYGSNLGKNAKFYTWGKYLDDGPEDSVGKYDDWRTGRGGFYLDWNPRGSRNDLVHVQGNFYGGDEGTRFLFPRPGPVYPTIVVSDRHVGENSLLARWTHTIDDETDWALQGYFDQTCRYDSQIGFTANTFDVDFQYRRPFGRRHSVIMGVEFRQTHDFMRDENFNLSYVPSSRSYNMTSGFFQDEIEMIDEKFYLTFGSKFEGNTFTGFEYQPSIRGLWMIDNRHVLWGAISRAVRTPNRMDENAIIQIYVPPPNLLVILDGNPDIQSENVIAYELGYRAQTSDRFSWDIALFYNVYQNLMGYLQQYRKYDPPYVRAYNLLENCGRGETYGFEWTASWDATPKWKLAGSYSFLVGQEEYYIPSGSGLVIPVGDQLVDPRNQVRLQSYWDVAPNWEFDLFLRYVDQLGVLDTPSYITMDARLGWRPNKNLEFSIVGQNLFTPHHTEFVVTQQYSQATTEINRAVFAKVTLTR